MNKYYQTDELQKQIDWDVIMKLPRYAGGHDEQMQQLFKDAEVLAHWNEGYYQGMVATCVKLPDGKYVIYNDYYGSCSGCDSWEDADDESVRNMCIGLSNSSYVFNSLDDVKEFLSNPTEESSWSSWSGPAPNLLTALSQTPAGEKGAEG